jgi:hypothetical protein
MALGLLRDDQEYVHALTEAVGYQGSPQLRMLFGSILIFAPVGNLENLWESFKNNMIDDFSYRD